MSESLQNPRIINLINVGSDENPATTSDFHSIIDALRLAHSVISGVNPSVTYSEVCKHMVESSLNMFPDRPITHKNFVREQDQLIEVTVGSKPNPPTEEDIQDAIKMMKFAVSDRDKTTITTVTHHNFHVKIRDKKPGEDFFTVKRGDE